MQHSEGDTHSTHALEAGVDLFQVKKTLGHCDLSSTLVYSHISDTASAQAHQRFLSYALAD